MTRILALSFTLTLLFGCPKPCEFVARCDGSVLETCSLGPDQLVGTGITRTDCADTVNPVCVEPRADFAFCATEAEPTCDFEGQQCAGDVILGCTSDYVVADDCALRGPTCVDHPDDGEPVCAVAPVTSCDDDAFVPTCADDQGLFVCRDGVVALLDCDVIDERATCGIRNGRASCSRD